MAETNRIVAALPEELVAAAAEDGILVPLPLIRSGAPIAPDVIVAGIQIVTTLVTFAQIPETFQYLSKQLASWMRGGGRDDLILVVRGPHGEVRLELDRHVNAKDIAVLLRLLAGDP